MKITTNKTVCVQMSHDECMNALKTAARSWTGSLVNSDFRATVEYKDGDSGLEAIVTFARPVTEPERPVTELHLREPPPQPCLCPATSEYDPPCPRHGVLGIGVTGR